MPQFEKFNIGDMAIFNLNGSFSKNFRDYEVEIVGIVRDPYVYECSFMGEVEQSFADYINRTDFSKLRIHSEYLAHQRVVAVMRTKFKPGDICLFNGRGEFAKYVDPYEVEVVRYDCNGVYMVRFLSEIRKEDRRFLQEECLVHRSYLQLFEEDQCSYKLDINVEDFL